MYTARVPEQQNDRQLTILPLRFGRTSDYAYTVFVLLVGLAAAFVGMFTARMTVVSWHALPYWDQWDNLISGRNVTWAWLISQHNEHRIFFPRLIYLADARFFQERNVIELVANFALQLGTVSILTILGLQLLRTRWRSIIIIGSFIFVLMFSAIQWENISSPFQVQFLLVCFAATACFALFVSMRHHWMVSVGVFLLQTLAVFSLASGILVPVVTIILALWLRRPRVQVVIQVVAATVLLGFYLHGYVTPQEPQDTITAPTGLVSFTAYLLNELGIFPEAFFGRDTLWIHIVSGGLGLILLVGLIATNRSRPGPTARAETPLVGIALFVLGMCVLTAFGRARFGIEQATSGRYVTPVLLFWTAIIMLCVSRLHNSGRAWGRGGLGLFTIAIAILEPRLATPAIRFARSLDAAMPAAMVPNGDRELLARLYPNPEVVRDHLPFLQTARTSIFAERWSEWLGKVFLGGQPSSKLRTCAGDVTSVVAVADGTRSGWRLTGQLREQVWPTPRLIILDDAARVVGVGVGGLDARAVDEPGSLTDAAPDRWLGEIEAADPEKVQIYALDPQDHAFCSLHH